MAVPKRRTSSTRRDKRRASTSKLQAPALSRCTQCNELKAPHKVCRACGYYKGKEVLKVEA